MRSLKRPAGTLLVAAVLIVAVILCLTTCNDFALKQTITDMVERKVELLGPDDEAQIAQKTPELTWSSIGDAASYEVQLSITEDFADPIAGTATEMKYEIPDPLTIGDDRYWRVRAIGADETEAPWSDVRSFEIVSSESPKLVNTLDLGAHAWGLEVAGDYLYSSAGANGIKVFDISSPAEPELIDTFATVNGNGVWDIFVSGDYVYASEGIQANNPYYVYLLDISDPSNVVKKDSYGSARQLYGLLYMGVSLYVGYDQGMYRFDSSPPTLGSPTADIDPSGSAKRVNSFDTYGSYLVYTVDKEGIRILQLNGDNEVGIAAAADPGNFDNSLVTVYDHYVYVTSMNVNYIEIFDIEDVTSPLSAATFTLSGGGGGTITVADHFAFAGISDGSIQILDITDPVSPSQWGSIPPEEAGISVHTVSGNYLYGTDYSNGKLKVVDLVPEAE